MMSEKFESFNKLRKGTFKKSEKDEEFLKRINLILKEEDYLNYQNRQPKYPFVFVFGLPRSGTTLMSQILLRAFDVGYINNFMARFWLAPLTGIRLSKIILGENFSTDLSSHYATTKQLQDIHEFGYFWRYWLNIASNKDAIDIHNRESTINWNYLGLVLSNIQNEFGLPLCMKNIFGAYHIKRFTNELSKVFWVYIERDPLDVAISILNARKRFYENLEIWWSTVPPEYDKLKSLNYTEQIAGQVYYLRQFYKKQLSSIDNKYFHVVNYENLCDKPKEILNEIAIKLRKLNSGHIEFDINKIPDKLECRKYEINTDEKVKLKNSLKEYNIL